MMNIGIRVLLLATGTLLLLSLHLLRLLRLDGTLLLRLVGGVLATAPDRPADDSPRSIALKPSR